MAEPITVTDAAYKAMLLELLQVTDPADSANEMAIERLEFMVNELGINLPIVRRIVPTPPSRIALLGNAEQMGKAATYMERLDQERRAQPQLWGQTDEGLGPVEPDTE